MPKRTYQPKKRHRQRVHGFRTRSRTPGRPVGAEPSQVQGPPFAGGVSARPTTFRFKGQMQRERRLTEGKRFSLIHREGRGWANRLLVLKIIPNDLDRNRFGFLAGKRIGKAVVRNRVKRRLREVCPPCPHEGRLGHYLDSQKRDLRGELSPA